jgi:hypothetical protein
LTLMLTRYSPTYPRYSVWLRPPYANTQHPFDPRGIFTDRSHTPENASLQQMVCDNIELRQHGTGGSGIVWLGSPDSWRLQRPKFLRLTVNRDSRHSNLNAYAYELLAASIALFMSQPLDRKSEVNRITDTLSPFSKAMGQHA